MPTIFQYCSQFSKTSSLGVNYHLSGRKTQGFQGCPKITVSRRGSGTAGGSPRIRPHPSCFSNFLLAFLQDNHHTEYQVYQPKGTSKNEIRWRLVCASNFDLAIVY